jgi:hypothetical protein
VAKVFEITTGEAYRRLQSMTTEKLEKLLAYAAADDMTRIHELCKVNWSAKGWKFAPCEAVPAPQPE